MGDSNIKLVLILSLMAAVNGKTPQCTELSKNTAFQESTIVDSSMKTLAGTWVSEKCETRPGPEYILRRYSFEENGHYKLIQHHYWDHSCSYPQLTIISAGHLTTRRDSVLHHDALRGYVKTTNITIIPQDLKAVKQLGLTVATHCPGQHWKSWRVYKEHLVYTGTNNLNETPFYKFNFQHRTMKNRNNTQHNLRNTSGDISCLGPLLWTFNEIRLIKVQLRPRHFVRTMPHLRWELLLGDVPSRLDLLKDYIPTAFQLPLVKESEKLEFAVYNGKQYEVYYTCSICESLIKNERVPPHLMKKPQLPPFIDGDWVSEKCEIRPKSIFLRRQFSFNGKQELWVGEHRFYYDPFCTFTKFVITTGGYYFVKDKNEFLTEAFNFDYIVEQASLVIFDRHMVDSMGLGFCGREIWTIGVPQDLNPTAGCPKLGIHVYDFWDDVIKVEIDYEGYWLLFMGQVVEKDFAIRPKAFHPPLIKCINGYFSVVDRSDRMHNRGNSCKMFYGHLVLLLSPLLGLENVAQIV